MYMVNSRSDYGLASSNNQTGEMCEKNVTEYVLNTKEKQNKQEAWSNTLFPNTYLREITDVYCASSSFRKQIQFLMVWSSIKYDWCMFAQVIWNQCYLNHRFNNKTNIGTKQRDFYYKQLSVDWNNLSLKGRHNKRSVFIECFLIKAVCFIASSMSKVLYLVNLTQGRKNLFILEQIPQNLREIKYLWPRYVLENNTDAKWGEVIFTTLYIKQDLR